MKTKQFPIAMVMNLVTGKLYTCFRDMMDIFEHLLGYKPDRYELNYCIDQLHYINPEWFQEAKMIFEKAKAENNWDINTTLGDKRNYFKGNSAMITIPVYTETQKKLKYR